MGRVSRWLPAIAIAVCAIGGSSTTASAGTYDVWSCRGPDGEAVGTSAWERSTVDPLTGAAILAAGSIDFEDSCDEAGQLSVELARDELLSAPIAGLLTLRPAADTRIASYELSGVLQTGQPPLLASYLAERSETAAGTPISVDACSTPGCMLGSTDSSTPGSLIVRPQAEGDEISLRAQVSCAVCLDLLLSDSPARAVLYRSRVTLEDLHPPAAPQLSGGLVEQGAAAGRASLVVASQDRGGGIDAVSLAIDGQPWQTVRSSAVASGCRIPYTTTAPCPAAVEQPFEIDTGALAPGDHEASGAVVDAAGNSTPWGPVRFRVERPPTTIVTPLSPRVPAGPTNGSPAVERPRLRLARAVVGAARGKLVRLRGTLTTADRKPIAGARLDVATRQLGLRGDVPGHSQPAVVTDAAGRFSIGQRARGARRVTVTFRPRPQAAATARALATVRAQLELRAAPAATRLVKGRLLTLRGRLLGAGASAQGALVQIQAIVNGRWAPVGRARAGRRGDYAWRYRFVHLSRDTRFSFRAVVEHVPGWPWPTVRGPRSVVRVDVP